MPGKLKSRSKEIQKAGSSSSAATIEVFSKAKSKFSKSRKAVAKAPVPASQSEAGSDEEEDEDDGVNEEGMKKLMDALGESGLDAVGQMQLDALEEEEIESRENEDEDEDEDGLEEDDSEGEDVGRSEEEESEEDESAPRKGRAPNTSVEQEKEEIALEDADSIDEDAVPRQKIVTDNKVALERIRDTIKLDPSIPWTETLAVTYPETIEVDVDDDLNRELAFYKQALHGATTARKLADQYKLPFTRPADYFAEMVKSDAHMERIRQRLLDEGAAIKKSEDKRREREGKKFGKQVQIEKLKERERSKKEMEERLKGLKRKHKDVLDDAQGNDDAFDVAVEDAISDRPSKRSKSGPQKISRKGRDAKFGFGGKGRRDKQNTRESTEKFDFGSRKGAGGAKGAKSGGKPKRLGKSRRMASRGR